MNTNESNRFEWISINSDKKPEDMQTVLLSDENDVSEGYFSCEGDDGYFAATGEHSWKFKRKNPTHWMPLPNPPKAESSCGE